MPSPVERWLQTFMCTQYAHIFDAYGYRSLQAVCHLQMPDLLAMGVPRNHCEKILENIHILRQTMFGRIEKSPGTDFHHLKYNPPLNPAVYALKTVAMNANYRGMSQFPEDYSGYGQSSNNMQAAGFHQSNYDGANMAMMNHMSGNSYGMQGYDASHSHMMMSGQGPMPAHNPMYHGSGNSAGSSGQYGGQQYPMQGGSGSVAGGGMQGMSSGASYYNSGSAGAMGQGSPSSKMVPPAHHHLRNTTGQQNPQQVADNILQMASSYPSHHTVQVPLKNRHAPYQIPRSPHYGYTADKGMGQQQGMGGQPAGSCQQSAMGGQQQQGMGNQGGMGQPPAMMYPPSSPHNQPQPRTSPMSPLMMHSPAHQPQGLPSPGAMHSPNSASVRSPAPSPSMRSPCSVHMSGTSMQMRSPGHLPAAFSGQQMNSPPHRTYNSSDVSSGTPQHQSQHCSPTSMHSPVSHVSSPYTPGGMAAQISSPPQQPSYAVPSSSPYKMDMLMDSGQGPGVQGQCRSSQPQQNKQQGTNPLQSLQKLVMLPETQVVDPKSVVSDACLPGSDQNSSGEGSKNSEDPAGQSEEAVGCSAGDFVTSSPQDTCHASSSSDTGSSHSGDVPRLTDQREITTPVVTSHQDASSHCMTTTPFKSVSPTSTKNKQPPVPKITSESSASHASKTNTESVPSHSDSHTTHTDSSTNASASTSSADMAAISLKNNKRAVKGEHTSAHKCNGVIATPESGRCAVDTQCKDGRGLKDSDQVHIDANISKPLRVLDSANGLTDKSDTKSLPQKRHSERFAKTASVSTQSQYGASSFVVKPKEKVVNGVASTHINGSANAEELVGHSFLQQKNSFQSNCILKKSIAADISSDSFGVNKKVTLSKLHSAHSKRSVAVSAGASCALVTVNGPLQAEMVGPSRLEHSESDHADTDEEVEKVFDGQDDTLSKLCSIFPPHVKSLGGGNDVTFLESGSDNEDFSFSDGFDLGYDSPPSEMTGDDNWKPSLGQTVSVNGMDEADGIAECSEQDSDKGISPKSKGSAGTGSPSKVNSSSAGSSTTRTVTRSSTGSIPKRKVDEDMTDTYKRVRRSSGATVNNHVPSAQCGNSNVKDDVKVVNSDNSPAKTGKDDKTEKDIKAAKEKNLRESGTAKNCQKSPVVVLAKSPPRVGKKKKKDDSEVKPVNTVTRFLPRAKNGRFITISSQKSKKSVSQTKEAQPKPAAVLPAKEEDTDDDDEPLIVVQRRSSKGEPNSSSASAPAQAQPAIKREAEMQHIKTEPKLSTGPDLKGTCDTSEIKASTPCLQSEQPKATSTPSSAAPVTDVSVSPVKSAPGTPLSASSVVGTPRKRGRPRKGEENKKKKGDNAQAVAGPFCPFVRVEGKKQHPTTVAVFNHPLAEKTDPKSVSRKKGVSGIAAPTTTIQITNFSSDKTVMLPSTKTDSSPWVCALCGMRSSYRFLGDLFGPYYLESHLAALNRTDAGKDSKKGGSGNSGVEAKMTRRKSATSSRHSSGGGDSPDAPQEVWVHEDCAMWSNGVYLVGSRVYGLEEALKAATATMCACCREKGAMVGCLHKGCNQTFHYMCAVDKDCYLDVENFSMLCPKHKVCPFVYGHGTGRVTEGPVDPRRAHANVEW
ncbi:hypothetical protein BaRGS_00024101, partial [Batillaria attramentaria]